MELVFLTLLIVLMATALGSGYPVAFALDGLTNNFLSPPHGVHIARVNVVATRVKEAVDNPHCLLRRCAPFISTGGAPRACTKGGRPQAQLRNHQTIAAQLSVLHSRALYSTGGPYPLTAPNVKPVAK